MTVIASLPVIDVYLAFDPTVGGATLNTANIQTLPSSGASNSYWTNISSYVRDFDTTSGKQHFLDRVEAGTLQMTVDGRDGFFVNGTVNGTGLVAQSRQPIAVTATILAATYPLFWGITDSFQESITDFMNVDFTVSASDLAKQLSLKYMSSTNFWATYAQSTSASNWYRCDSTNTGVITSASGNGTTITYYAFNNFSAGQNVTISGLGISSGKSLNLVNATLATANPSSFTITNATVGVSTGTGSAYRTAIADQIGTTPGNYMGIVAFPLHGAMLYDTDGCVDVTNGGTTPTGYIRLGTYTTTRGAIDFWILGQGIGGGPGGQRIVTIVQSGTAQVALLINATGFVIGSGSDGGAATSTVKIDDGYWHHIGLVADSSGYLHVYADGQFFAFSGGGPYTGWTSVTGQNTLIPPGPTSNLNPPPAYFDEIVISDTSSLSTLDDEVRNRYRAGTLLQLPTNPAGTQVLSGDRIAEILCVAGFGTIVAGAVVLNANTYYINDGSAWSNGTSGNGFIHVEPWYWDTPVTGSTALDLIGEITDSDVGVFFQKPDGTLNFYNQNFYGTWAWNATTNTGTWTPNSYTPAADHIWTDDNSGYAYVGHSLQVVRDDTDTWTQVKITPQAGIDQIYENVAAEARWGFASLIKSSTVHPTLNLALSTAKFLGHLFRSPLPRVQNVELSSNTVQGGTVGGQLTAILAANNGQVVTFIRTSPNASTSGSYPSVNGQINTLMVIESKKLSFKADPGTLVAAFTLDPYPVRS